MPAVSTVSSLRKITLGMIASQHLAMANDIPDVGKSEVAIALKRAALPLGLTSTAYHVLDILLGLSKSDDWQGSNRPIVAISNEKLAAYVGRSERKVRCSASRSITGARWNAAVPTQSASVLRWISMPDRARIWLCRCKGKRVARGDFTLTRSQNRT